MANIPHKYLSPNPEEGSSVVLEDKREQNVPNDPASLPSTTASEAKLWVGGATPRLPAMHQAVGGRGGGRGGGTLNELLAMYPPAFLSSEVRVL